MRPNRRSLQIARGDGGASAVEYALLIALIAAIIVVAVLGFGILVKNTMHQSCIAFTSPGPMGNSSQCTQ